MRHHRAMIDADNTRDPLLMVLEALKECTRTMRLLVSAMERADGEPGPRRPRTRSRPLPAGMTAWVSAEDVVHAVDCSRSKANEYLRAGSHGWDGAAPSGSSGRLGGMGEGQSDQRVRPSGSTDRSNLSPHQSSGERHQSADGAAPASSPKPWALVGGGEQAPIDSAASPTEALNGTRAAKARLSFVIAKITRRARYG
jgi:hypothetical protein